MTSRSTRSRGDPASSSFGVRIAIAAATIGAMGLVWLVLWPASSCPPPELLVLCVARVSRVGLAVAPDGRAEWAAVATMLPVAAAGGTSCRRAGRGGRS